MSSPTPTKASDLLKLRAWQLGIAGPSVFWYFPVIYALLSTGITPNPQGLLALFIVMILSASWGFLVNDLADRSSDAASGRADATHGHGLSRRAMVVLILITAGASWAVVFAIGGGFVFKVILAVNYVVAILYSVPPAKLKIRRFWGFFANTVMERPLPILVLLTYMDYYRAETILFPILMELTWSVFKHQAADLKEDKEAGIQTFAVALGEKTSYRIVNNFLNPVSVLSLLSLLVVACVYVSQLRVALALVIAVMTLGFLLTYLAQRRGVLTSHVTPTDPPYIMFLNVGYRFIVLPVMGIGLLVLRPDFYLLCVLLGLTLLYQAPRYYGLGKTLLGHRSKTPIGPT